MLTQARLRKERMGNRSILNLKETEGKETTMNLAHNYNDRFLFFNYIFKDYFVCGLFFFFNLFGICFSLLPLFTFWFFGCEACGILAPWPGIEPLPPLLKGEVLTTGPPGKSLTDCFMP